MNSLRYPSAAVSMGWDAPLGPRPGTPTDWLLPVMRAQSPVARSSSRGQFPKAPTKNYGVAQVFSEAVWTTAATPEDRAGSDNGQGRPVLSYKIRYGCAGLWLCWGEARGPPSQRASDPRTADRKSSCVCTTHCELFVFEHPIFLRMRTGGDDDASVHSLLATSDIFRGCSLSVSLRHPAPWSQPVQHPG